MLKLTRIAAVALIGLAVLLALIAFMIGRKPAAPVTAAPIAHNEVQAITVVEAVARLPAGEPISANDLRLAQRCQYIHRIDDGRLLPVERGAQA